LMDNADRLAEGRTLNPPVTGSDEIAYLDHVFHNMAQTITEASTKMRAIIESLPVALAIIDKMGVIESTNPALETMLGYSRNELIGRHISALSAIDFGQGDPPNYANNAK